MPPFVPSPAVLSVSLRRRAVVCVRSWDGDKRDVELAARGSSRKRATRDILARRPFLSDHMDADKQRVYPACVPERPDSYVVGILLVILFR